MNLHGRADWRQQRREDAKILRNFAPIESGLYTRHICALTRQLASLIKKAKRDGDTGEVVKYIYGKADETIQTLSRECPVACRKGCSHCCYIWAAAYPIEVFFIAAEIKKRSDKVAILEALGAAHEATKDYPFDIRDKHPYPCALLKANQCSLYAIRPVVCRFAASADAEICARAYRNVTEENIPTPLIRIMSLSAYSIATSVALKENGLSHKAYQFNSALLRALERDDAEQAWLAGEDVFAGILEDPNDPFLHADAGAIQSLAFSNQNALLNIATH